LNANELANLLEVDSWYKLVTREEIATMLRQQQDEIEALKAHPVKEQYKFGVDWSKDGNAVTVLKICEDGVAEVVFMDYQEANHPIKELTDEEIGDFEHQIIRACGLSTANSDINPIGIRQIIKEILRKAQENG
jgi:acetylglutamate kinase